MNTPAHTIFNLVVLGHRRAHDLATPIVVGSLLPDAPMFLFYFWVKLVDRLPESVIWGEAYFRPGWQTFFDIFNALPLILPAAALAYWLGRNRLFWLFASMALHALMDLPLHHDDGHRHFWPLSDWRFESPISYWDPAHHGMILAPLEAVAVLVGCWLLARRYRSRRARWLTTGLGAIYLAGILFFVIMLAGIGE